MWSLAVIKKKFQMDYLEGIFREREGEKTGEIFLCEKENETSRMLLIK
jgi:hypothetical protein